MQVGLPLRIVADLALLDTARRAVHRPALTHGVRRSIEVIDRCDEGARHDNGRPARGGRRRINVTLWR
jgi:hypothetical protein